MSSLVKHTKQRGGEVGEVVARGQADIVWAERGAEGMCRRVDASGLEVEADAIGDFSVELLLFFEGVASAQQIFREGVTPLNGLLRDPRDSGFEVIEKSCDVASGRSALITVEEGIVGFISEAPQGRFFASDADNLSEMGGELREVGTFFCLRPRVFRASGDLGLLSHESGGNLGCAVEFALPFREICRLGWGESFRLSAIQQGAKGFPREQSVRLGAEIGELGGSILNGERGHVGLLIPPECRSC